MKIKLVNEKLSPAAALYGFTGWLTSRDKKTIMSSKDDAGIIAKLVGDFIEKQDLEDPKAHWEKDLIPMNENKKWKESFENVKNKIKKSKKLPKEIKEEILKRVITSKFGTRYNNGVVTNLKRSPGRGCSLGADKDGWFVFTHRARSKSKSEINKISQKDIKFIESTG